MARFKARARALDMLGRQQIAGIPTALHELFKNAYDAYAENVEVDFYRKSNILLLRDDGIGMSREDFENRWLTLGTESKLEYSGNKNPAKFKGRKSRPVMGEKGIGRLAIASIGPIVLVMTKPKNTDAKITLALIQWGVFALPGIDLGDIEIPIVEIDNLGELSPNTTWKMKEDISENLKKIDPKKTDESLLKQLVSQISGWQLPINSLKRLSYGPSLSADGHGTQFVIHPVNEELKSDIDDPQTNGATNLQRMLLGFSDSSFSSSDLMLSTNFRDHKLDGQIVDQIGDKSFFTKEETVLADHDVSGKFDEYGNFRGEISVYGRKSEKFDITLFGNADERLCGSFDIKFSYVQGAKKDSKIPSEDHALLTSKLDKIGGLYIYKNGIRVLPYGNSDYDFLEIERRRTLSASYYFFSYRRMFGSIHINSNDNRRLREKAGREGFQNNLAYRQFREQLMLFFQELAGRFFREEGAYAEEWKLTRTSLQKEHELLLKRQKQVTAKRSVLERDLELFFKKIENLEYKSNFNGAVEESKERVTTLSELKDHGDIAERIINLERDLDNDLRTLLDNYVVHKPRGVGLTKKLTRLWEKHRKILNEEIRPSYEESRKYAAETIGKIAETAKIEIDARMRMEALLQSLEEQSRKKVNSSYKSTQDALKKAEKYVREELSNSRKSLQQTQDEINKSLITYSQANDTQKKKIAPRLEANLLNPRMELETRLENIRYKLVNIFPSSGEEGNSPEKDIVALETELEILREDYSQTVGLAQIGMAVSIVQHEFEANITGVRKALNSMSRWTEKNESLKSIYLEMRDGFDHLDNYLSLFAPLDKRTRRRKTKITGEQIFEFLSDLFKDRLERHNANLKISPKAGRFYLNSYASVILPVFVNLADNSIYWLDKKDGDRSITLDADKNGFKFIDNGPGVPMIDQDYMFDFGYTQKLGGRGMGLYIAKTSLNKEGLDISYDKTFIGGAAFRIGPKKENE